MAAESNTPVDIEIWIEKVINSCQTLRQRSNAQRLVKLYIKKLQNDGLPHYQTTYINDKFESLLWSVKDQIRQKNNY